jgi:hypothetical protein
MIESMSGNDRDIVEFVPSVMIKLEFAPDPEVMFMLECIPVDVVFNRIAMLELPPDTSMLE